MTQRQARRATVVAAALAIAVSLLIAGCPQATPGSGPAVDVEDKPTIEVGEPDALSPPTTEASPAAGAAPTADGAAGGVASEDAERNTAADPASPEAPLRLSPDSDSDAEPSGQPTTSDPAAEPPAKAPPEPAVKESGDEGDAGADGAETPKQGARDDNREPLFAGWPKPQLAFVLSGRQSGYVEPCGCTGLDNQKGGMARRHVFLQSLAQRGWEVAPLDVGSQVRRYGAQAELKFQMSVDGLKKMGYRAVAFGAEDLRLSIDALIAASVEDSPFISANASILGLSKSLQVFELGGRKVGVTAVLGERSRQRVNNDEVEIKTADEGLKAALGELAAAKCDYVVVLAHTTLEEARALVPKYPQVDLIVTSGGAELPAYRPEEFEGSKTRLVQVGAKGMYAGVLALFDDEKTPIRFERVPLDSRFTDSPDMRRLMKSYQEQLAQIGLEKLGVRPLPHPSGRKFVGSAACGDCHTQAFEIWSNTPHSHATESIKDPQERSDIPRHFDPECISCHVTGWNPQKYTPYTSGYLDFAKSAALHGNGCENCHGPGSKHVAAESGEEDVSDEEAAKRRAGMRLAKKDAERKCLECHDRDNSPDFHVPGAFETYWNKVKHYGRD